MILYIYIFERLYMYIEILYVVIAPIILRYNSKTPEIITGFFSRSMDLHSKHAPLLGGQLG